MFRIFCLRKGETAATLAKEVLYRRYLKFYLSFHIFYAVGTLCEYFAFLGDEWDSLYLSSSLCLMIDCALIMGLLFRPDKGPDRRVICGAFVMTCLSLLMYTVSRLYAFASPDTSGAYIGILFLFLLFFIFTKSRCMYHIYRFNRFNSFEKHTNTLSVAAPIGINENSWTGTNEFAVGAGGTDYVTMDIVDDDQLGALPPSRKGSFHENIYDSRHSTNESLDLGNTHVSVGSGSVRSDSEHSFHAVSGAEDNDNDTYEP